MATLSERTKTEIQRAIHGDTKHGFNENDYNYMTGVAIEIFEYMCQAEHHAAHIVQPFPYNENRLSYNKKGTDYKPLDQTFMIDFYDGRLFEYTVPQETFLEVTLEHWDSWVSEKDGPDKCQQYVDQLQSLATALQKKIDREKSERLKGDD
jgi:hypothetical protein